MEGDGAGPAGLGQLYSPGTRTAGQFGRQLGYLPLSLSIKSKLVLHGDLGQLLLHVPDALPQAYLILGDVACKMEDKLDQWGHQQEADEEEATPQQQIHCVGSLLCQLRRCTLKKLA